MNEKILLEIIASLAKEAAYQKGNADVWYQKYKELESRSLPIKKVPEDEPCQTITD